MTKDGTGSAEDTLTKLIQAADIGTLGKLVHSLAASRPDIRRECFEFLQKHVTLDAETEDEVAAGELWAIWDELEPDLSELDEYGGGPEATEEKVADLLHKLTERLNEVTIPEDDRQGLRDEALIYYERGNAGMDDLLSALIKATY